MAAELATSETFKPILDLATNLEGFLKNTCVFDDSKMKTFNKTMRAITDQIPEDLVTEIFDKVRLDGGLPQFQHLWIDGL